MVLIMSRDLSPVEVEEVEELEVSVGHSILHLDFNLAMKKKEVGSHPWTGILCTLRSFGIPPSPNMAEPSPPPLRDRLVRVTCLGAAESHSGQALKAPRPETPEIRFWHRSSVKKLSATRSCWM